MLCVRACACVLHRLLLIKQGCDAQFCIVEKREREADKQVGRQR